MKAFEKPDIMAGRHHHLHLALFFTKGVSLQQWEQIGILERETLLYSKLSKDGHRVTFVTYGDNKDLAYKSQLPGIQILCNRWNLKPTTYGKWLWIIHYPLLRRCDFFKTNQMSGADVALRTANFIHKPLLARCGYRLSKNVELEYGARSDRARWARRIESDVFRRARQIVVTTGSMRRSILKDIPELDGRVNVIPNYVDTDAFSPGNRRPTGSHLVYVGRLSKEKNLEALFDAVRVLPVTLEVIGDGSLKEPLRKLAETNPAIRFLGSVPNSELPDHFRKAEALVLPSFYEGNPKVIIEAMAAGLPVIGTNVSGINELIRHGENGWLCDTDAGSLRTGIQRILEDRELQSRLAECARADVLKNHAIDAILTRETAVYAKMVRAEPSGLEGEA